MTTTIHLHWRDVPEGAWRWPNFSAAEIACRGTGKLFLPSQTCSALGSRCIPKNVTDDSVSQSLTTQQFLKCFAIKVCRSVVLTRDEHLFI
jgi:hypothetical protein